MMEKLEALVKEIAGANPVRKVLLAEELAKACVGAIGELHARVKELENAKGQA